MATIYEVSKLAGVSLATVSRVMNDSAKVSDKTREKVLAAMRELDYRPNSIAQSLASNRSNCVGLLVSELHGPIFGAMISGIEQELRQAGKFVIASAGHSDAERERQGIHFLVSRNCDALILHVEATPDEDLLELFRQRPPVVLINRLVKGMEDRCIRLDNVRGGYLATRHLLNQGHRDIAYISGPLWWGDARDRLKGHKQALEEAGIDFDERLSREGDYHESGGARLMESLFDSGRPFTAVACGNDEMAAGVMDVVRTRGFSIPDDISIIGFDNARWSRYLYPKLTTINYPVGDMGAMAAIWVLKRVYDDEERQLQTIFEPELVLRGSTGPAPRL